MAAENEDKRKSPYLDMDKLGEDATRAKPHGKGILDGKESPPPSPSDEKDK